MLLWGRKLLGTLKKGKRNKRNLPQLTEDKIADIKKQLTSQMNFESGQEVNCTLLGKENEEDNKELKRK